MPKLTATNTQTLGIWQWALTQVKTRAGLVALYDELFTMAANARVARKSQPPARAIHGPGRAHFEQFISAFFRLRYPHLAAKVSEDMVRADIRPLSDAFQKYISGLVAWGNLKLAMAAVGAMRPMRDPDTENEANLPPSMIRKRDLKSARIERYWRSQREALMCELQTLLVNATFTEQQRTIAETVVKALEFLETEAEAEKEKARKAEEEAMMRSEGTMPLRKLLTELRNGALESSR